MPDSASLMARKLKDTVRVPLPTTQVGKYPRPSWYAQDIRDRTFAEASANEPKFREAYADAVKAVLLDQEISGLDIVTDGCIRYDQAWSGYATWDRNFIAYVGGLRRVEHKPDGRRLFASIIGEENYGSYFKITGYPTTKEEEVFWWVVEDEPSFGKLSTWVEAAKIALPFAHKPLKFSGPSASVVTRHMVNKTGKSDRDIYFQLHKLQNNVLREIANAGYKIIQIDFPFGFAHWAAQFSNLEKDVWNDLIQAFNESIDGVNANIWVHFCFGAPILYSHETPPHKYHMANVFPNIVECKADVFQSEAANTKGIHLDTELKAWMQHCSEKDYAVGAITPYNLLETTEDVERIIGIALKYVPPEKLALTSDEGLWGHGIVSRDGAIIKMKMLATAAKKARTNLGIG